MTSQTISLDLVPQGVPPIIHVSQYDTGQTWLLNILKGGSAFSIPAGSAITVQGTKADGTGFQYSCTYSGSQVTVTEQRQMTIFAGDVATEIRISNGAEDIGTLNFIIRVEPAALADDTEISETDLPLIQQAVLEVPEYARDAEAWANGTRGGTPVTSGDPAFEHNAKYYADNFIGMITDAQWASIETILT